MTKGVGEGDDEIAFACTLEYFTCSRSVVTHARGEKLEKPVVCWSNTARFTWSASTG